MKSRNVLVLAGAFVLGAAGAVAWAQTDSPSSGDSTAPASSQQAPADQPSTDSDSQSSGPSDTTPEQATIPIAPPPVAHKPVAAAKPAPAAAATAPGTAAGAPGATADQTPPDNTLAPIPPLPNSGPPPASPNAVLMMTGLDKITGRPTQIAAPLNVPVQFATLTITARYCYSTPASETPETSAFVQIDDHRPDQSARRVFSGWMYASSPGLNGMEHPLYDVWVISCKTSTPGQVAAGAAVPATGPAKVLSPDASDQEGLTQLPEGSGQ
jgi:hypothetical protein